VATLWQLRRNGELYRDWAASGRDGELHAEHSPGGFRRNTGRDDGRNKLGDRVQPQSLRARHRAGATVLAVRRQTQRAEEDEGPDAADDVADGWSDRNADRLRLDQRFPAA